MVAQNVIPPIHWQWARSQDYLPIVQASSPARERDDVRTKHQASDYYATLKRFPRADVEVEGSPQRI